VFRKRHSGYLSIIANKTQYIVGKNTIFFND
jgi:hypothetical protein